MAATKTAAKAMIVTPDHNWGPVRLRIWGNTATIRHQITGATIELKDGVAAVSPTTREGNTLKFTLTFDDGTVWDVTEPRRGCGCGK